MCVIVEKLNVLPEGGGGVLPQDRKVVVTMLQGFASCGDAEGQTCVKLGGELVTSMHLSYLFQNHFPLRFMQ